MGGLLVYLVGWSNLKKLVFGLNTSEEQAAREEAAKKRKLEKRTILRREHL
jgi:hypothetical protein